ncbi:MAG TPA: YCF48-related protein [Solimonas sp.]|nr:YCF48-related protein [Solimonas sp.]
MSRRMLPVALLAAWVAVAGAEEESSAPAAVPGEETTAEGAAPGEAAPPPEMPRAALMVSGAAKARLLDLSQAGKRLVAVGQQGVIVVSDNGKDWRQVAAPASVMLTRVRFLDDKLGWAVGYDGTILHSADGGLSWTLQHSDPEAKVLYDVLFLDAQNGIAVGAYGAYYRTADGGKTWEPQTSPIVDLGQHFNRLMRLDANTLFIAGERGMLARSTDGGANWTMMRSPYIGSFFGAISLGGRKVLAYGMRGNAYVIDDVMAVPEQDPTKYDPYTAETLTDPAQIAAIGWRRLDNPVKESLFGGTRLPDGSVLLVGINAVALKTDASLQSLKLVKLPAEETLADVLPYGSTLLAVGRRGVQNLGALP